MTSNRKDNDCFLHCRTLSDTSKFKKLTCPHCNVIIVHHPSSLLNYRTVIIDLCFAVYKYCKLTTVILLEIIPMHASITSTLSNAFVKETAFHNRNSHLHHSIHFEELSPSVYSLITIPMIIQNNYF